MNSWSEMTDEELDVLQMSVEEAIQELADVISGALEANEETVDRAMELLRKSGSRDATD